MPLDDSDRTRWYEVLDNQPAVGKTSMLQDVEAGRPTEVDIFAGRVIALGREHDVATPYNQAVIHIIRAVTGLRAESAARP